MKGNEALAEAAIRAGCRHFFGYPITPQTELAAYMSKKMPKIGGTYLQAESEIAAINMVLGASSAGVRAMTSSSSPGISLKTEGIQPSQADYWQATKATGHGDFQILVFATSTVQEMVDFVSLAFDLGDKYRMPAMILADGMLGQMMEPVEFKDQGENAKIDKPWALTGHQFKRPHNVVNSLYLKPADLERLVKERFERYETIKKTEQRAEEYLVDDADIVVVAYGASSRVARSAVNAARAEGIKAGLIRPITLWPFPTDALQRAAQHVKKFLAVEMSMGQMVDDVRLAIHDQKPVEFYGRTGGMIPTPAEVLGAVKKAGGVL